MASLYNTPWGQRELSDDEAAQLRGQVGADAINPAHPENTVSSFEGLNPIPEGE